MYLLEVLLGRVGAATGDTDELRQPLYLLSVLVFQLLLLCQLVEQQLVVRARLWLVDLLTQVT